MDLSLNMRGLKGNVKKTRHLNTVASSIPPSFLTPLGIQTLEKKDDDKVRKRGEHRYTKFKGPYENEFMR